MKANRMLCLVSMLWPLASVAAGEAVIDKSATLVCAAGWVVVCSEYSACEEKTPEEADMPRFVTVDIPNRMIDAAWPPGPDKVSRINSLLDLPDRLVLQGVDVDVPWSATLGKESGKLVVTQSRDEMGFTLFGACMPLVSS